MSEICADCGSQDFKSCFSETFPGRTFDGRALMLTLRLCLRCGARFRERGELREHLFQKLPAAARERARV